MGIAVFQHGRGGVDVLRVETHEVCEPAANEVRLVERVCPAGYELTTWGAQLGDIIESVRLWGKAAPGWG